MLASTHHTFIMRWSTAALLVVSVGADQVKYPIIKAWTKHIAKSESDTMLTREPRNAHNHAQQNGYGAPEKEEEVVDLHNKEFCVDVSTFQEVVWVERDGEMCKTDFVKQCEQKSENVCADVTETRCQVSSNILIILLMCKCKQLIIYVGLTNHILKCQLGLNR